MDAQHNLLTLPLEIREKILQQLAPTTTVEAHLKSGNPARGSWRDPKAGHWKFFFGCRDCDINTCPWPRDEHVLTDEVSSRYHTQRDKEASVDSENESESDEDAFDRVEHHIVLDTCRQLRREYIPLLMREALFCLDLVEDPVPEKPLSQLLPAYFLEQVKDISIFMQWGSRLTWLMRQLPRFVGLQNVSIEYMKIPMISSTIPVLGATEWTGEQALRTTPAMKAAMREAFLYQELRRVPNRKFKLSIRIEIGHFDANDRGRHMQGNTFVSNRCPWRLET